MAGLANDNNPFQSQVRLGIQYIQLVPGPKGLDGSGALGFENNGTTLPPEPIINFIGFTIADNPGATRTDITAPATLLVQSNGNPITQRASLDLEGFTYADDSGGNRMKFTAAPVALAAPGATIAAGTTLGPTDYWKLFQAVSGGYGIVCGALVPGFLYRLQHVGGAAGTNLLETSGQAVTFSRGSNTFTIEDPQNRLAATANSVTFQVSNQTYEYMLDATNNVLRCMRQVQ